MLVTFARSLEAAEPMHESVEDPVPPDTLAGESVQDSRVELVLTAKVTVLVKPFMGMILI